VSAALDFTVRLQCFSGVLTKRRVCRNQPTRADCCRKTKCEMRSTGRPTHRSFSSRPAPWIELCALGPTQQPWLVVGVARSKALAHGILLLPQRYPEASLYCRQSHKPLKLLVNGRGLNL
jgi:hypothetical protein